MLIGNNRTQCHFILLPIVLSIHHERQDKAVFFFVNHGCVSDTTSQTALHKAEIP